MLSTGSYAALLMHGFLRLRSPSLRFPLCPKWLPVSGLRHYSPLYTDRLARYKGFPLAKQLGIIFAEIVVGDKREQSAATGVSRETANFQLPQPILLPMAEGKGVVAAARWRHRELI
ncbi:PIF-like protein [Anopheles sinensis]|uniref:PIF-like protein n=1 Tax=Anopheles sinensis TaxID=74873 RepID=A0A084WIV5_ANOSI|nr:PIF-like protein [Anopheles sinensis]